MVTEKENWYVEYCPKCPHKIVGNWYSMIQKQMKEHMKKHKKKPSKRRQAK